jgi:lipoteichoic acid synthase
MRNEGDEMKKVLKRNWRIVIIFITSFIAFFLIELLFRIMSNQPFISFGFVRLLMFTTVSALIMSVLLAYLPEKLSNIGLLTVVWFFSIYSLAQLGFKNYLGNYFSWSIIKNTVGGVAGYAGDFLKYLKPSYFLTIIPAVLLTLMIITKLFVIPKRKPHWPIWAATLILTVALHFMSVGSLYLFNNETALHKAYSLYDTPVLSELAITEIGLGTFMWRDLTLVFKDIEDEIIVNPDPDIKPIDDKSRKTKTELWKTLADAETNSRIKKIDDYLLSKPVTPRNDFTGTFEGKNLIYIMVEAMDLIAIDQKLTPTLYRLTQEGWYFDNYYAPNNSCATGESEFMSMVSLIPSTTVCTPNSYYRNDFSPALMNLFKAAGYSTNSYHSYSDKFYPRSELHLNYGSSKFYNNDELDIKKLLGWPSDINLFDESLKLILKQEKPFMSFIITAAMHLPYDIDSTLGNRYLAEVRAVYPDYPIEIQRYISKSMDFDKAVEKMINTLDAAGELEDTVLILFADHHPLRINASYLMNATQQVDRRKGMNIDLSPMIIYNPGLTPRVHSMPASTMDLAPTVANLFDLEFDPRFYMGIDVFSDVKNVVIFPNGSWKTAKGEYSAPKGKFTAYFEDYTYTSEEIAEINQFVRNQFAVSEEIYKTDYFKHRLKIIP